MTWNRAAHIRWKVEIPGAGTSSPIVWGDQIFILTAVKTARTLEPPLTFPEPPPGSPQTTPPSAYYQFLVICLERTTGHVRWQRMATEVVPHEGHHRDHGYASSSPTTDGECLYVSFGSRGIY